MSVPVCSPSCDPPLLDLALAVDDQDVGAGLIGEERRLRHHERRLRLGLLDHHADELAVDQQCAAGWERRPGP